MRKEDIRKKRTKKQLKNAMISLLESKTIEKMSVIDICEVAQVNRVTFYSHYKDKYELIYDLLTDITNVIRDEMKKYVIVHHSNDIIKDYVNAVSHITYKTCFENKKFLLALNQQENSTFILMIDEIITKNSIEALTEVNKTIKLKYPPQFIAKFVLGGVANLIFGWALHNDEMTEDEFFKHFDKFLYSILKAKIFFE